MEAVESLAASVAWRFGFSRKRALYVEKFDLRNNFHIILNKIFVHHHFMYQVL